MTQPATHKVNRAAVGQRVEIIAVSFPRELENERCSIFATTKGPPAWTGMLGLCARRR